MQIRTFTPDDVPAAMALKSQAGWNQVEADIQRLLRMNPKGCFVADDAGSVVGTVATTVFDSVAWVSMMLVDQSQRGQGIGRRLMEHALAWLDAQGTPTVRLDATAMGKPLYESLGFVSQSLLDRWAGVVPTPTNPLASAAVLSYAEAWFEPIVALDQQATQTHRRVLLRQLANEHADRFRLLIEGERLAGFATSRPGSQAAFLGPVIAAPDAATTLLDALADPLVGQPVFIDLPRGDSPAVAWCRRMGLTPQRELVRMVRGREVCEDPDWFVASSGPEKG